MSEDLARLIVETHKRAAGFANDMRRQGIHVGLGNPPACVTCGQPWPCDTETREATDDSIEPPPTKPMTDARLAEIRATWYEAGNVVPAVYELLAEVDRSRAEVTALTELIDGVKDGAKELVAALPGPGDGTTDDEAAAYVDCAETWHHMIREVLGDV